METFKSLVYPLISGNACYNCHSDENPVRTPLFAQKDASRAYEFFLTGVDNTGQKLADLDDIPNSRWVFKGGDTHCGPADCSVENRARIQAALEEWVRQNPKPGSTPPPSGPIVEALVPSTVSANNYSPLSFSLDVLGAPGATLSMEITRVSGVDNVYRLRRPRLTTKASGLRAKELFVYMNGVLDLGTIYATLDNPVEPNSTVTLSALEMDIVQGTGPGSDKIGIVFKTLATEPTPTCNNLADFTSTVRPVLANRCFSCHSTITSSGVLPMGVTGQSDADMCAKAKQRKDVTNAASSVLIKAPTNSNLVGWWHPALPAAPSANDIEALRSWLASE